MASYATADALRAVLALPAATEDAGYASGQPLADLVQGTLDAATRQVDEICGRTFTPAEATATIRKFRPSYRNARRGTLLLTDDFAAAPTLVTDNGEAVEADLWEVVREPTEFRAGQHLRFPKSLLTGEKVAVTARWGWPSTPPAIVQATLMMASRIYTRQKTPLGIHVAVSQAEMAMAYLPRKDHHVMELLDPYIRARIA